MSFCSDRPPTFTGSWAQTAIGHRAVKRIVRTPTGETDTQAFDAGAYFRFRHFACDTPEEFAASVAKKAQRSDTFMVYGRLIPGLDPREGHRRLSADPDESKRTLTCCPTRMFVGDVDKVAVPPGLGSADRWLDGVSWVRENRTPAGLAKAKWVVLPSASTGMKADDILSFRFFCVIDEPVELAVLKRWSLAAKKAGYAIDDAVHQVGQPIFFARPIFEGMQDPLRDGGLIHIIDGEEAAHIDLDEFADREQQYDTERRALSAEALEGGWLEVLAHTIGGFDGFNHPLKRAARHASAQGVSSEEFVSSVWPLVERAATAAGDKDRLALYAPGELRRLYRNFTRIDNGARAQAQALLQSLGLK